MNRDRLLAVEVMGGGGDPVTGDDDRIGYLAGEAGGGLSTPASAPSWMSCGLCLPIRPPGLSRATPWKTASSPK